MASSKLEIRLDIDDKDKGTLDHVAFELSDIVRQHLSGGYEQLNAKGLFYFVKWLKTELWQFKLKLEDVSSRINVHRANQISELESEIVCYKQDISVKVEQIAQLENGRLELSAEITRLNNHISSLDSKYGNEPR